MSRVAPITGKSDVPAEHHAIVDGVLKTFGRVRGPFSMLLHSPQLAQHFLGVVNFMLIARAHIEASDLQSLVAAAKQQPGKISFATWGTGSTAHVALALLEQAAGVQLLRQRLLF